MTDELGCDPLPVPNDRPANSQSCNHVQETCLPIELVQLARLHCMILVGDAHPLNGDRYGRTDHCN